TGCQVTLTAGVDLGADGSGTVHAGIGFDDEAVGEIGDLGAALRTDDMRAAGWDVVGPAKEDDGLTWVRAAKGFDDPDEAAAGAAEVGQRVALAATGDLRRLGPLLVGALILVVVAGGLAVVVLRAGVRRRKRQSQR